MSQEQEIKELKERVDWLTTIILNLPWYVRIFMPRIEPPLSAVELVRRNIKQAVERQAEKEERLKKYEAETFARWRRMKELNDG